MNAYKAKLWAIIERDFAGSLMNTTKWMEALDVLRGQNVVYRMKLITEPDASGWFRYLQYGGSSPLLPRGYVEGYYSPIHALEIEWLEIEGAEHITEIESAFLQQGIPFRIENEGVSIRIQGHVRRGKLRSDEAGN